MSLINDALKRATGPRKATGSSTEGMYAANLRTEVPTEGRHKLAVSVLVLSMVGGLILATVAYLWRKETNVEVVGFKRPHTIVSNTAPTVLSNPVARAAAVLRAVAQQNSDGEAVVDSLQQAPANTSPKTDITDETKAVIAAPAQTPVAPPLTRPKPVLDSNATPVSGFPSIRLQAIYFRLKAPTAMINGKTVSVGEMIDGVKVLQIQRQSVRVALDAEVRELRLR